MTKNKQSKLEKLTVNYTDEPPVSDHPKRRFIGRLREVIAKRASYDSIALLKKILEHDWFRMEKIFIDKLISC